MENIKLEIEEIDKKTYELASNVRNSPEKVNCEEVNSLISSFNEIVDSVPPAKSSTKPSDITYSVKMLQFKVVTLKKLVERAFPEYTKDLIALKKF